LQTRGAQGYALYALDSTSAEAIARWPYDVLAELNAQGAVLSVNARPPAIEALRPFVNALDGCTVLFSHLGLPGRFRERPPDATAQTLLGPLLRLAELPNVTVKFSGLYAVSDPAHDFPHHAARPFVEALLTVFGPHRVMWGSDFPPALDYVSFAQTLDNRLLKGCTSSEVAEIMGGNLVRVLGRRT
jgi:predicted TIM-barrel fold metal-dependent hydrolase